MNNTNTTIPNTLIVRHSKDLRNFAERTNISYLYYPYKGNNFFYKVLKRIPYFCCYSFRNINKNIINKYDVIIISDTIATNATIKWFIKNKKNDSRLIVLCLNKAISIKNITLSKFKKWECEVWSYNRDDCYYFHFNYFNQFLNYDYFFQRNIVSDIIYDAIFMGAKKDREKYIRLIKDKLDEECLNAWFYVPDIQEFNHGKHLNERFQYNDYVSFILKSKSIIDIVSVSNYGLTWRPIEALFLGKKLITNYIDIQKEDFYCQENIYIIGLDKRTIKEFLNTPNKQIDKSILLKYDFNSVINTVIAG